MSAAAAAKSLQSCLTLYDPIDGSWPGSTVPGILQARTLEWVAISFSNAWEWKVKVKSLSHVRLFAAHQAPLSMGFSRQEYWCGVPSPSSKECLVGINLILSEILTQCLANTSLILSISEACIFLWESLPSWWNWKWASFVSNLVNFGTSLFFFKKYFIY